MNDDRLEAMGDTPGSDLCGCMRASTDEVRVFRQTFVDSDGNVTYGPEEIIDAGPFAHPGIGSFVELDDGWYRLRRA